LEDEMVVTLSEVIDSTKTVLSITFLEQTFFTKKTSLGGTWIIQVPNAATAPAAAADSATTTTGATQDPTVQSAS
jgi:hypothetical protein